MFLSPQQQLVCMLHAEPEEDIQVTVIHVNEKARTRDCLGYLLVEWLKLLSLNKSVADLFSVNSSVNGLIVAALQVFSVVKEKNSCTYEVAPGGLVSTYAVVDECNQPLK